MICPRRVAVALMAGLGLAGCAGHAARRQVEARGHGAARTGCDRRPPAAPGHSVDLTVRVSPAGAEGRQRRLYRLHVPAGYRWGTPVPLVLVFHGSGGSAEQADALSGWSALADRRDFAAVYPQGLPFGPGGAPAWASAGPVDYGIDDLGYVRRVLTDVRRQICVNRGSVFVTGMSSGGGMAGYLACAMAGQIAAAAPVAGNHYNLTKLGCHPSRPVAILEVHGTADATVPYAGVPPAENPTWPLPSIPKWISAWRRLDHCANPRHVTSATPRQTIIRYGGCEDRTAVLLYRMNGGGHADPVRLSGRPTDVVMDDFFAAHRR